MRKKLLAAASFMALLITACSGNSGTNNTASQEAKTSDTSAPAESQEAGWAPKEDIEFIVGNSAGGGADLFTR